MKPLEPRTLFYFKSSFLKHVCVFLQSCFFFISCAVKVETNAGGGASSSSQLSSDRSPASSDTTIPTVLHVIATNSNGAYVTADVITVEVTFSEAVTVDSSGGIPYITLETGTIDRNAVYSSGSGSNVLIFTHTLVDGDQNGDLDYKSTTALSTNGGSIKDSGGNSAILTLAVPGAVNSISDNQAVVVCAHTVYSGLGSGTQTDPYLICTAAQLADIGANTGSWNSSFKLLKNINLSAYTQAADGTQWIPIGTSAIPFTGVFDGDSKTISNFTYTDNTRDYLGIFGYIKGGRSIIKNFTMTSTALTGRDYVGSVAGYIHQGQIINVSVSGTISSRHRSGGVVGVVSYGGMVGDSKSSVTLSTATSGNYLGGIAGYVDFGSVFNSMNTGSVSGAAYVGGISAYLDRGRLVNVFNTGTITSAGANAGGILGASAVNTGQIRNTLSTGNIQGTIAAGSSVGPICGGCSGLGSSNSYYSSGSTITNTGTGNATNTNFGTGAVESTFYVSTNAPLSSWNFTDTWSSSGTALPTLAPTLLSSSWGTCADHLTDTPFAGGAGTLSNPYLICTGAQMNTIGTSSSYWVNHHYKMMDDISLAAYTGTQYNVIGTSVNPFSESNFDGNGKSITDFTYTNNTKDYFGLFGYISVANIHNIAVIAPQIVARSIVSAVVGQMTSAALIQNSYVSGGSIIGTTYVAGVVGNLVGRAITQNSYSTATITGTTGSVAGAVGYQNSSIVLNVFAAGNVIVNAASGGTTLSLGGNIAGSVSGLYYDSSKTCINCSGTNGTAAAASADLMDKTKAPLNTWDFNSTWLENSADYPSFQP